MAKKEPLWIPRKFQTTGIKKIYRMKGRDILADEQGLGKTSTVLGFTNEQEHLTHHTLVVCKANLKWHWQREARNFFGKDSVVLSGQKPYNFKRKWLTIINYDILKYWVNKLMEEKEPYFNVIFDEGHELCNPHTQRARASKKVVEEAQYVHILTGTPISSTPGDLWFLLYLTRPDLWGNQFEFGMEYTHPRRENGIWLYKGAVKEKLPELHRILKKTVMIRRTKEQVAPWLPAKSRYFIPLDIDRTQYDMAERDFVKWLKQYKPGKYHPGVNDPRIQVGYLLRLVGELKIPSIKQWIDDFLIETDEKLILFSINKCVSYPLYEYYKALSVFIDGKIKGENRQAAVDRFNRDDECKICIGQLIATCEGWSAETCPNVAFTQLWYKPNRHLQGEDRGHGINRGGGKPFTSWFFMAANTVEEDLASLIQDRYKICSQVLDGKSGEGEFDVLDEFLQNLKRKWHL